MRPLNGILLYLLLFSTSYLRWITVKDWSKWGWKTGKTVLKCTSARPPITGFDGTGIVNCYCYHFNTGLSDKVTRPATVFLTRRAVNRAEGLPNQQSFITFVMARSCWKQNENIILLSKFNFTNNSCYYCRFLMILFNGHQTTNKERVYQKVRNKIRFASFIEITVTRSKFLKFFKV